jgi:hypothetical protein
MGRPTCQRAIGGTYIAYRDHLGGFLFLTVVTGAILVALGSRFWSRRHDITMLLLGFIQAAAGLWAHVERFSVHG